MAFYLTILPQFLKLIWYLKIKDNKRLTVVMTSSHLYLEIVIRCCWRQDAQLVLHDGYWTDKSLMKNCKNVIFFTCECSFIFGKKPITSLNWQVHMWFTMPTAWYNEREHGSHMWRSTFNVTVFIQLYLHLYRLFSMWEFFFFVSFVEKANHEWKCDDVHHFLFMLKFQLTCNTCLILWFSYVKRNIRHFTFDVLFLQYLKFWVTCKKKQKQVHLQFMWKTENITHGQSNCQTINWQSFVNTSHVTLFSFHMWHICSVHSVFKPVSDWLVLETC